MVSRLVMAFALFSVALSSPIIKIKTVNGQKRQYCCYGVVKPFDMSAKAKQGMRALAQAGFNLRKLRIVLDIHQKAVNGKLENMEKESEALNKRVKKALQATMKILGDATKKAARTLSEVTEATNDLGKLGKDIQDTKTHDMITKIRHLIENKPIKKKTDEKKHETKANDRIAESEHRKPEDKTNNSQKFNKDKTADHRKSNVNVSKAGNKTTENHKSMKDKTSQLKKHEDKKLDNDKRAKSNKSKMTKEKDRTESKKNKKSRHPKDIIPRIGKTDDGLEAQRLLENAEMHEIAQVKMARDAIEKRAEDNKRAFDRAKIFLRQIQDGLLQIKNGFKESGITMN